MASLVWGPKTPSAGGRPACTLCNPACGAGAVDPVGHHRLLVAGRQRALQRLHGRATAPRSSLSTQSRAPNRSSFEPWAPRRSRRPSGDVVPSQVSPLAGARVAVDAAWPGSPVEVSPLPVSSSSSLALPKAMPRRMTSSTAVPEFLAMASSASRSTGQSIPPGPGGTRRAAGVGGGVSAGRAPSRRCRRPRPRSASRRRPAWGCRPGRRPPPASPATGPGPRRRTATPPGRPAPGPAGRSGTASGVGRQRHQPEPPPRRSPSPPGRRGIQAHGKA